MQTFHAPTVASAPQYPSEILNTSATTSLDTSATVRDCCKHKSLEMEGDIPTTCFSVLAHPQTPRNRLVSLILSRRSLRRGTKPVWDHIKDFGTSQGDF